MGLEQAFNEIIKKRQKNDLSPYCSYQMLYLSLNEADQKALDNAWANNYPMNLIVQALRKDGHKCSADVMRTHRNGTCKCPKD